MSVFFLYCSFSIAYEVINNAVTQEKEITGIQIGKKERKLPLFTDDTIMYVEYPKEKLLKLMSGHSKAPCRCKVNIQKSIAFLCTNNKQVEFEIKNKNHL